MEGATERLEGHGVPGGEDGRGAGCGEDTEVGGGTDENAPPHHLSLVVTFCGQDLDNETTEDWSRRNFEFSKNTPWTGQTPETSGHVQSKCVVIFDANRIGDPRNSISPRELNAGIPSHARLRTTL